MAANSAGGGRLLSSLFERHQDKQLFFRMLIFLRANTSEQFSYLTGSQKKLCVVTVATDSKKAKPLQHGDTTASD